MIDTNLAKELEEFVRYKAPGLVLTLQENPGFGSTTLGLGVKVDLKRLISGHSTPEQVGAEVVDMIAEVQKATVTAIGMEEYVRQRELAVLDRLQERLHTGDAYTDRVNELNEARRELGG